MYKIFRYGRYGETILSRQSPITKSLQTDPLDAYQPTVYIVGGAEPTLKERSIPIVDTDTTVKVTPEEAVVEYVPTEEIDEAQEEQEVYEGEVVPSSGMQQIQGQEAGGYVLSNGEESQESADIVQVTESDLEGKSWWNWKSFGIGVGAGVGFFGLIWLFSRGGKKRKR